MASKKYFFIVAIPLFALVLVLLGFSFYLQPFTGDLTRIGGYTENDFGWNNPQFGYSDVGTYYAGDSSTADGIDYAIYGDSFSYWCSDNGPKSALSACFQWTAFFKQRTSLQGLAIHQDHSDIEAFVKRVRGGSEQLKFVIYQSVERYAVPRLMRIAEGAECDLTAPSGIYQLTYKQTNESLISVDRVKKPDPFDMNIPSAYLKQLLVSFRKPRVFKVDLNTDHSSLFSNRQGRALLYHREDLNKTRYTSEHYKMAKCGMNVFAAKIQQELGLPTFFMIAPDKSAVYGEFFKNQQKRIASLIPHVNDQNVNFVDLLSPMVAATKRGVVDVYLPNDTHWGASGGQMAANALADAIEKRVVKFDET